jgi:AcrR family transcriptional regulator
VGACYNNVISPFCYSGQVPARIDPGLRGRLVEELVRRLGDENPTTIRSLATAVGTSTMTIYTHFGGMPGLWSAAREEGFRRLAAALAEVRERDDPGEQVMALASAYVGNAFAHPGLYLTMFDARHALPDPRIADHSFERLIAAAERARQAGRFRTEVDSGTAATRMWSVAHGLVMLTLTGALPPTAVADHLPEMSHALFVGFGDEPEAAQASITAGWQPPPATA